MRLIVIVLLLISTACATTPDTVVQVIELDAVSGCNYVGKLHATPGTRNAITTWRTGSATREEALAEARRRGANRVVWRGAAVGGALASPPGMLFRCPD